jgi:hypothetical protein
MRAAKPREAPQDFADPTPKPVGPANAELARMARDMAKEKRISFQQAFSRIYTDPDRKELKDRVDRESAEATRRVAQQRWPLPA